MNWHVEFSFAAERQLKLFPQHIQRRIVRAIDEMEAAPFRSNVLPLKGRKWRGRYRKRVGRYRIIFMPYHETRRIEISAILLRDEQTYR